MFLFDHIQNTTIQGFADRNQRFHAVELSRKVQSVNPQNLFKQPATVFSPFAFKVRQKGVSLSER